MDSIIEPQITSSRFRTQGVSVKISNMAATDTPGARLRAFRTDRGLTGQALAEALDATKSTISYWEAGRTELPRAICLALETLFGVSSQWLATGEGPMWTPSSSKRAKFSKDHLRVPFLSRDLGFSDDGAVQEPHPDAPTLDFPRQLLGEVLGAECRTLYLWHVADEDMAPRLPQGSWALVDVSPAISEHIVDHAIYLVRLGLGSSPCLRRLATDPISGDLLVATDTQGRVPLRLDRQASKRGWTVLARAVWVGTSLM